MLWQQVKVSVKNRLHLIELSYLQPTHHLQGTNNSLDETTLAPSGCLAEKVCQVPLLLASGK